MKTQKSGSEKNRSGKSSKRKDTDSPEKDRMKIDRVKDMADSLCRAEGIELVHVEYQREPQGRILRLYIDKPGGVRLDDCASVSRQLGDLLDVEFEHKGTYRLEVSSPGPDRPLGKMADYDRFKGNQVKISLSKPLEERKQFQGILNGISEGMVSLRMGEKTVNIPFAEIIRARLVNYMGEKGC